MKYEVLQDNLQKFIIVIYAHIYILYALFFEIVVQWQYIVSTHNY